MHMYLVALLGKVREDTESLTILSKETIGTSARSCSMTQRNESHAWAAHGQSSGREGH